MKLRLSALPFLLSLLTLVMPTVWADEDAFSWDVEIGMANEMLLVAENTANPLRVTMTNRLEDFEGTLRIDVTRDPQARLDRAVALSYSTPLSLPLNSRKTIEIPFFCPEGESEVELHLIDESGNAFLPPEIVGFVNLPLERRTVLVVGDDDGTWNRLRTPNIAMPGLARQMLVVEPTSFPNHWSALSAANTVLWDGERWPDLDPAQVDALERWINRGGVLVMGTGGRWAQFEHTPLHHLLPVEIDASESRMARQVSGVIHFPVSREVIVAQWDPRSFPEGAETLLSLDGEPLMLHWRVGKGHVLLSSMALSDLWHVAGRSGDLLSTLITPPDFPALATPSLRSELNAVRGSVTRISRLSVPEASFIGKWVILMWLLLVPVNFSLAWVLKRPRLAWWLIPAIALLGTVHIFHRGLSGPQPTVSAQQIQIAACTPNTPWVEMQGLISLYSPIPDTHSFRFPDTRPLITPFIPEGNYSRGTGPTEQVILSAGDEVGISDLELGFRTLRTFPMLDMIENPADIRVTCAPDGQTIRWDAPLSDVAGRWMVIRGREAWEIPREKLERADTFPLTEEGSSLSGIFQPHGSEVDLEDFEALVLYEISGRMISTANQLGEICLVGLRGETLTPMHAESGNSGDPSAEGDHAGTGILLLPVTTIHTPLTEWTHDRWNVTTLRDDSVPGWNSRPQMYVNSTKDLIQVLHPSTLNLDGSNALDLSIDFDFSRTGDRFTSLNVALFDWSTGQWVQREVSRQPNGSTIQNGWRSPQRLLHPLTGSVLLCGWMSDRAPQPDPNAHWIGGPPRSRGENRIGATSWEIREVEPSLRSHASGR